jgi:sulfoquinovosyltransferase
MPSESETLGFVVLEAMASGVPVVGVEAGGIPNIINNRTNGFMARPTDGKNALEFSNLVRKLVEDPKLSRKMGKNARVYAESLSWDSASQKLKEIQYPAAVEIHRSKISCGLFVNRNISKENEISSKMDSILSAFDKQ